MKSKLLTLKIRKRMTLSLAKSKQNMTKRLRILKKRRKKFVMNSVLKKISTKTSRKI